MRSSNAEKYIWAPPRSAHETLHATGAVLQSHDGLHKDLYFNDLSGRAQVRADVDGQIRLERRAAETLHKDPGETTARNATPAPASSSSCSNHQIAPFLNFHSPSAPVRISAAAR